MYLHRLQKLIIGLKIPGQRGIMLIELIGFLRGPQLSQEEKLRLIRQFQIIFKQHKDKYNSGMLTQAFRL